MRIFWILLFVLLLLGQLITFVSSRGPIPVIRPLAAEPVQLLDELVSETREIWKEALHNIPESSGKSPGEQESVLDRGQFMLELRDMEQALDKSGKEYLISKELSRWINASSGRTASKRNHSGLSDYLVGLKGWLETCSSSTRNISLERSFLNPETTSDYPCLSFEMIGSPLGLGSILIEYEERFSGWKLKELDLIREADNGSWWLRGSFAFKGEQL